MADALSTISTRRTPQNEKADVCQAKNWRGWLHLQGQRRRQDPPVPDDRDRGWYLLHLRAEAHQGRCCHRHQRGPERPGRVAEQKIVEISTAGRAPKQNPGIFALAVCGALGNDATRKAAKAAYLWCAGRERACSSSSGTPRTSVAGVCGLRRAVGDWIVEKDSDKAAYQMIKYRQREGWSQRDLPRLSHPKTTDPAKKALFDWVLRTRRRHQRRT